MTKALSLAALEQLRSHIHGALSPELLSRQYRPNWSPENPTAGFCSVASEAAWFVLGGPPSGWVPHVVKDGPTETHWWLEHKESGQRFDPTEEQYRSIGEVPPYERGLPGVGTGFMGMRVDEGNRWGFDRKPSLRARLVLDTIAPGDVAQVEQFRAQLFSNAAKPRLRR